MLTSSFGARSQTDPNWGNFLYDEETDRIYLIDFGAARDFPKVFVDNYLEMVGDSFKSYCIAPFVYWRSP